MLVGVLWNEAATLVKVYSVMWLWGNISGSMAFSMDSTTYLIVLVRCLPKSNKRVDCTVGFLLTLKLDRSKFLEK